MNLADVLILLGIACVIMIAFRSIRRSARKGCSGCCAACHSMCAGKNAKQT